MLRRFLTLALSLAATSAVACPVCGQVAEQGQGAYLNMTYIMSLLPLFLMGGIATWVGLRIRAHQRREEAEAASVPVVPERKTPVLREQRSPT